MNNLEQRLTDLDRFFTALSNYHEQARPKVAPLTEIAEARQFGAIIVAVRDGGFDPSMLLAMFIYEQREINRQIMALLTDLDYRKADAPGG